MPKNRFNEAERYLITNWRQACMVEDSMVEIRRKYAEIYDRVWEAVQAAHEDLDFHTTAVTQFWCEGYIGVGKKAWQKKHGEPPGIYVENLRLELLLDDNAEPPLIGVWTGTTKKPATDAAGLRQIVSAAGKLLAKDKFARCEKSASDYAYVISYSLPETRQQLVEMLLDEDGQQFADCIVSHFEVLARLIPVLDKVFSKPAKPD
ncbi:MAG TPA: hypothetical protein VNA25_25655 [Phycisphaerae bacterium]|nr:hypothetical protein [Phycisphaerae bacterium]